MNRGVFQTQTFSNTIWNHDLIFAFDKDINSDIHLNARVGGNARNDASQRDGIYSENQTVFGLMNHSNFQTSSSRSAGFDGRTFYRITEQQRYGVYGDFSFDYKDYLFVNLAGRNDWTSTLEEGFNSLFYPSASASFIPTEAFANLKSNALSMLKLRVGYGTSAGFPGVYATRSVVSQNLRGFIDASGAIYGEQSVSDFLGNARLRAELQQELEAGVEAKFLRDRIGIDLTVYDRSTRDLITTAPIDPATGFTATSTNIGKLSNKGVEIALNGTLVQRGAFTWNSIINYTMVRPKVEELGGGISEVVLSGFTDRGNFAIPGRPTNVIKGTSILRDPNGNRVVGSDGLYVLDPILREIGDPNPKYLVSFINTLDYKGFSFSFQFDYRHGGYIYSSTASAVLGRGTSDDVDFNHDLTFVLPGVKNIGTTDAPNYVANDIQITASDYGFNTQFFGYTETGMFDATTIRLREVSLSYNFPKSMLSKTPFTNLSLQVNGNNLWFNAVNVPKGVNFDTEVSSQGVDNGLGFDYLTGPSTRRYGVVLRLSF
jgi:hypothetical protein